MKIIVTQEILDMNPELSSLGHVVGDEINVTLEIVPLGDEASNTETFDGDPTGPGQDRPKKPPIRP